MSYLSRFGSVEPGRRQRAGGVITTDSSAPIPYARRAWYISAAAPIRVPASSSKKSVRVSNPTDPAREQSQSPPSRPAPGARAGDPVQRVMLVSGLGVTLAIVGLVVTLLVGTGSGEADSDSALSATTTESSTPAAAAAPAPTATTTGTAEQFLAELTPVGSTAYTGSISINGDTYPHAIYQQFSGCSTEVRHTYELNREWSRFSSVIGVADGGNTESALQFSVVADGKSVFTSGTIGVGVPPKVDIPVAGVQNLTIAFTLLDGDSSSCTQLGNGVWGDPTLTK